MTVTNFYFIFIFLFCRASKVLTRKELQNYTIAYFALVLPLNGNLNFTSIASFGISMKRSKQTYPMNHPSNAPNRSANILVLPKPQLFATMALPTKLSPNTLKRQLKKIQAFAKWQKRRSRHPPPHPIFLQEDVAQQKF